MGYEAVVTLVAKFDVEGTGEEARKDAETIAEALADSAQAGIESVKVYEKSEEE